MRTRTSHRTAAIYVVQDAVLNETFKQVFQALEGSYQSVEVRAILVALGRDEGWRSAATIIRLSNESLEELHNKHRDIIDAHRLPKEVIAMPLGREHHIEPFRGMNIELSAYPISDFWQLFRRFDQGLIDCNKRAFHIWEPGNGFEINDQPVVSRRDAYATDDGPWDVYYFGLGSLTSAIHSQPDQGGNRASVDESDLNSWAREVGQSNYRAMFERFLGVAFGVGHSFEIRAPIYARIDDIMTTDKSAMVIGSFSQGLGPLSVECSFYRIGEQGSRTLLSSAPASADIITSSNARTLQSFSVNFNLESPPTMGMAEATIHTRIPIRVDLFSKNSRLRSGSPWHKALTSFIPVEDVTDLLSHLVAGTAVKDCAFYKKFTPKNRSKKLDELLEYLAVYLLGSCHLNPILLSNPQYDSISGSLNAGSADILAATSYMDPLLVSCTMGMPDVRKAGMLTAARTAISSRLHLPEERIGMILITGKPSVSEEFPNMAVLGANDLLSLWELLQSGELTAARRIFGVVV